MRAPDGVGHWADAVSIACNPSLWGGGFVAFLALRFGASGGGRWLAAALGFAFVGAIPVALLFVLRAMGRLRDVEMGVRAERSLVYAACAVSYAVGAMLLSLAGAAWPGWGVVAAHVPATLVLMALNRRSKVSIHAAGLGGILAAGLLVFGAAAWPLALVLGAGAWGRWAAGAHTPGELVLGAGVGLLVTGTGLVLVRYLVGAA